MINIKKIFSFFILLQLVFNGYGQKSVISGKVTGFAAKALTEFQLYYNGATQKIKVDKETFTFKDEIDLKTAQFIEVKTLGSAVNFIYGVPGTNIELTIAKPILAEAEITIGEGDIQKLNQVMDRFFDALKEAGINTKSNKWITEIIDKPESVNNAVKNATRFVSENGAFIDKIAPQFKAEFGLFADMIKKYVNIDEYSESEIEKLLEGISKSEIKTTDITIPAFREYLVDLTNAYAARKLENYGLVLDLLKEGHISQYIAAEACVKYIPSKAMINYLFYDKVSRELMVNNVKHPKYVDFLFAHSSKTVFDAFGKKYEDLKANSKGNSNGERVAAKDFEFHDVNGKLYRLADFKGKLLLIDFWASWCAPCKVQMPYMKELEKHYEGKAIVFAKVSLDASEPAWIKGIADENLEGVVLHAKGNFKNPFPLAYGINAIPRFMLIDADGKIISDNLPKPQNKKEVMALIDADLYKAEISQIVNKHIQALGADKLIKGDGYKVKAVQSLMGIEVDMETRYVYPKNLRFDNKPKDNEKILASVGEDFFKKRYVVLKNDTVSGDVKNLKNTTDTWQNKLYGLDIFLATKVLGKSIDLAEENATNTDNQYVLKAVFKDQTVKYFIDKSDFLIKKINTTSFTTPRQGGGIFSADSKYENYKNINGVMIPHSINMNNMISIKVTEAEVKPIDAAIFSNSGK